MRSCLIAFFVVSGCLSPVDERADGGASAGGSAVTGGGAASVGGGSTAGGAAGGSTAGGSTAGGSTAGGSTAGGSSAGGSAGGSGVGGGSTAGGGATAGGSGGGAGSCRSDAQCGPGELCYDCGSFSQCAAGCSANKRCPNGSQCVSRPTTCLTCPCPQTFCDAPCTDADNDGYAPIACSGLPGGDCAPNNPLVHPGARELCSNTIDDDCDGLIDASDPQCPSSCGPATRCSTPYDCALGSTMCNGSCCQPCPIAAPPQCPPNSCLSPAAPNPQTGCFLDVRCVPCASCPAVNQPVCAQLGMGDARTFGNRCIATSAGATVIHEGACAPGEGLACLPGPSCSAGQYCRDACPTCDHDDSDAPFVCTKIGACVSAIDCPAGGPMPPPMACPNGSQAPVACINNACVRSCTP